jgi:rRNA processing protein Krr1/Pno1
MVVRFSTNANLGANIKRIVIDAGGPDQSHQVVRFPERGSDSSTIRVEGTQTVVAQVIAAIEKFVIAQENQVTDTVDVPLEKHGQLIGQRGEAKRNLEQQFNVSIEIPKKGSDRTDIKIAGSSEDVAKAKTHLAGLADQKREGETLDVPKHLHHAISENGRLFWRLKNDHDVTIDHGGVRPPPKSKAAAPRPRTNGNAAPLITDEDSADAHSWVIIPAEGIEGGDGSTIPWILSGPSTEKVGAARKRVQKALETASQPSATGFLTLSDPRYYRYVIGPGGRNINSIREQTGCAIQVPNAKSGKGGDGEAIEIVGSAEGCEEAKDLVLEFVRSGAARA